MQEKMKLVKNMEQLMSKDSIIFVAFCYFNSLIFTYFLAANNIVYTPSQGRKYRKVLIFRTYERKMLVQARNKNFCVHFFHTSHSFTFQWNTDRINPPKRKNEVNIPALTKWRIITHLSVKSSRNWLYSLLKWIEIRKVTSAFLVCTKNSIA